MHSHERSGNAYPARTSARAPLAPTDPVSRGASRERADGGWDVQLAALAPALQPDFEAQAAALVPSDAAAKGGAPGAVVQRKLSFGKQKQFENLEHLRAVLKGQFAAAHHARIDAILDEADGQKWSVGAVDAYRQIMDIAAREGWAPVAGPSSSARHGPQLPRLNATHTAEDPEHAMSTFAFSSVTIARADVIDEAGRVVSFEGRNDTASGQHAEDVLVAQIEAHLAANRLDPKTLKLRITINNAPCGPAEKDCAGMLSSYASSKGFVGVHIYYQNNYGADTAGSVKTLQASGVAVSQFRARDVMGDGATVTDKTRAKLDGATAVPPAGARLDPWSDSEDERDAEGDVEMASARGRDKREREEPSAAAAARRTHDDEDAPPRDQRRVERALPTFELAG